MKRGEITPTRPKVIGVQTLNIKPNLKFLPLNILGTRPLLGCALASLGL